MANARLSPTQSVIYGRIYQRCVDIGQDTHLADVNASMALEEWIGKSHRQQSTTSGMAFADEYIANRLRSASHAHVIIHRGHPIRVPAMASYDQCRVPTMTGRTTSLLSPSCFSYFIGFVS